MSEVVFKDYGKTSRLFSDVVLTEKVNGSNCAVVIEDDHYYCQSRNRLINIHQDHQGFAGWVDRNAPRLIAELGNGRHYGEWTLKGLKTPKFFLFNTARWSNVNTDFGLSCVPVLYEGRYYEGLIQEQLEALEAHGSYVYDAPPEGVCIYWRHDQTIKKAFTKFTPKSRGNI